MKLSRLLPLIVLALVFAGCAEDPEDQEFFYNSWLPSKHPRHSWSRSLPPPEAAPAQPPPAPVGTAN